MRPPDLRYFKAASKQRSGRDPGGK